MYVGFVYVLVWYSHCKFAHVAEVVDLQLQADAGRRRLRCLPPRDSCGTLSLLQHLRFSLTAGDDNLYGGSTVQMITDWISIDYTKVALRPGQHQLECQM